MPDEDEFVSADKENVDDEERAFEHAEETRDEEQDDARDEPDLE